MDPPLGNGSDSEEERLGPMTYQCTLSLLSDDKKTAPTRFELFHARKEVENVLRTKGRLIAKSRQLLQMVRALTECLKLFSSEIFDVFPMTKFKNLQDSKILTRSMTTNIIFFLSELSAIWTALLEKRHTMNELEGYDDLGQFPVIFVRDLNKLKDRIMVTKQLRNQLFRYLES